MKWPAIAALAVLTVALLGNAPSAGAQDVPKLGASGTKWIHYCSARGGFARIQEQRYEGRVTGWLCKVSDEEKILFVAVDNVVTNASWTWTLEGRFPWDSSWKGPYECAPPQRGWTCRTYSRSRGNVLSTGKKQCESKSGRCVVHIGHMLDD
jgi:hypothetical protein